jgi:DNA-binding transcriptional regulator YiaG
MSKTKAPKAPKATPPSVWVDREARDATGLLYLMHCVIVGARGRRERVSVTIPETERPRITSLIDALGPMPNRLRQLRERAGMTQGDVAERLNISIFTYWRWETGKSRPQGAAELLLLANVLGVADVAELEVTYYGHAARAAAHARPAPAAPAAPAPEPVAAPPTATMTAGAPIVCAEHGGHLVGASPAAGGTCLFECGCITTGGLTNSGASA